MMCDRYYFYDQEVEAESINEVLDAGFTLIDGAGKEIKEKLIEDECLCHADYKATAKANNMKAEWDGCEIVFTASL